MRVCRLLLLFATTATLVCAEEVDNEKEKRQVLFANNVDSTTPPCSLSFYRYLNRLPGTKVRPPLPQGTVLFNKILGPPEEYEGSRIDPVEIPAPKEASSSDTNLGYLPPDKNYLPPDNSLQSDESPEKSASQIDELSNEISVQTTTPCPCEKDKGADVASSEGNSLHSEFKQSKSSAPGLPFVDISKVSLNNDLSAFGSENVISVEEKPKKNEENDLETAADEISSQVFIPNEGYAYPKPSNLVSSSDEESGYVYPKPSIPFPIIKTPPPSPPPKIEYLPPPKVEPGYQYPRPSIAFPIIKTPPPVPPPRPPPPPPPPPTRPPLPKIEYLPPPKPVKIEPGYQYPRPSIAFPIIKTPPPVPPPRPPPPPPPPPTRPPLPKIEYLPPPKPVKIEPGYQYPRPSIAFPIIKTPPPVPPPRPPPPPPPPPTRPPLPKIEYLPPPKPVKIEPGYQYPRPSIAFPIIKTPPPVPPPRPPTPPPPPPPRPTPPKIEYLPPPKVEPGYQYPRPTIAFPIIKTPPPIPPPRPPPPPPPPPPPRPTPLKIEYLPPPKVEPGYQYPRPTIAFPIVRTPPVPPPRPPPPPPPPPPTRPPLPKIEYLPPPKVEPGYQYPRPTIAFPIIKTPPPVPPPRPPPPPPPPPPPKPVYLPPPSPPPATYLPPQKETGYSYPKPLVPFPLPSEEANNAVIVESR